ncbi:MAG TPA: DinB family protein [Dehalococcoidia bacterium]|nr:DinB family protein [Dehalococcoidia bacterium]
MVERVIHSADRLEIIEALREMPDAVEAEIAGLPEQVLRFKPSDNEWSIKEVVGHLRDGAEVWHKRLYQVWAQNDPMFVPYDQDAYVRERGYQEADLRRVIEEMRRFRLQTVDLLAHAVDWSRLGQWPGVGRRSLKQLAQALVDAEKEHLEQIRSLKALAATGSGRA